MRFDAFTVGCTVFEQKGVAGDRGWPNLEVEIGLAELVFGKSIGRLRSQENVPTTTVIVGPQLMGVVNDDDTIVGDGYTIEVKTSCQCSQLDTVSNMLANDAPYQNGVVFTDPNATGAQSANISIASSVALTSDKSAIKIRSVILNSPVCGGSAAAPVCTTLFSNHTKASVLIQYMTDGTTASIAQKYTEARYITETANLDVWAYKALVNMIGTNQTAYPLPPMVPGMMTPILWWATADLMTINTDFFEAGMETYFAILFRAGVQRTYDTAGSTCVRNIIDESKTVLKMEATAVLALSICVAIQFFSAVLAVGLCTPWFFSSVPTGPAIRALKDNSYFSTLLADSNLGEKLNGLCNAPTGDIWRSLDVVVQIGETIATKDDDYGRITMDMPELVNVMINGRKYM
jgi:hypothetical protein